MKQPSMGGDHLEMMSKALGLTPEQMAKAEPLMDKTRARMKAIQEESAERIKAAVREAHAQLVPLLNDEQKKKFRAMHEHKEKPAPESARGAEAPGKKSPPEARPEPREASGLKPPREPGNMTERIFASLGLSPDQKEKVKVIMDESHGRMKELSENSQIPQEDKMRKSKKLREEIVEKIKPILNPEQVKKLEELKARHEAGERREQVESGNKYL